MLFLCFRSPELSPSLRPLSVCFRGHLWPMVPQMRRVLAWMAITWGEWQAAPHWLWVSVSRFFFIYPVHSYLKSSHFVLSFPFGLAMSFKQKIGKLLNKSAHFFFHTEVLFWLTMCLNQKATSSISALHICSIIFVLTSCDRDKQQVFGGRFAFLLRSPRISAPLIGWLYCMMLLSVFTCCVDGQPAYHWKLFTSYLVLTQCKIKTEAFFNLK